jgi:hypothetical protein
MSTLIEKLEALRHKLLNDVPDPRDATFARLIAKEIAALLADHAKEGDIEEPWNGPWVCEGGHTFEPPYDEVAIKYLAANNPVCIFDKSPLHHHERRSRPAPAAPDALREAIEKHRRALEADNPGSSTLGHESYDDELYATLGRPAQTQGGEDKRLREAIRARMRLYDSQVDSGCIGTGYDANDIITMSELEQLVGFERAALGNPRKEGE